MLDIAELTGTPLTVSIGAAVYDPAHGEPSSVLLHRADAALYAAKSKGRNRVEMAEPPTSIAPRTESGVISGRESGEITGPASGVTSDPASSRPESGGR
jgi:hypothetical protein